MEDMPIPGATYIDVKGESILVERTLRIMLDGEWVEDGVVIYRNRGHASAILTEEFAERFSFLHE